MFFYREDAAELALGLDTAQWVSITLLLVAAGFARRQLSTSRGREPKKECVAA
jgi:hypothetical protein